MDELTYTLRELCRRNRDGSHATQADRQRILMLASRQLREAGFWQMRATSLKGRHMRALITRWKGEKLAAGTPIVCRINNAMLSAKKGVVPIGAHSHAASPANAPHGASC